MLTRRGPSIALAILSLIAATGARGQVYSPPPDDLVEPQPPLPPAIDPGVPAPAPPPPSAPNTMTVEEAKAEARSTGSSVRGAYQGITEAVLDAQKTLAERNRRDAA